MNLYGEGSRGLAFVVYSFTYAFCVAFLVIRTRTLLVQKRGYGAAASASQSIIIGQKAAKLAAFLVLLACSVYVFWSGIAQFVVDWRWRNVACEVSVLVDVGIYGAVKVLVYLFLATRAVIVISSEYGRGSFAFWGCVICILPILAILPLMVVGRAHDIRQPDGTCMLGEQRYTTGAVLGWDVFSTLYLSLLFGVPLLRRHWLNAQLRLVAIKSLIGAVAALIPTTINIALLLWLVKENFRLCYILCSVDVCFQSAVVFLLTSPSPDQDGGNLSNFSGTRSGQALPMEVPSGGGTRRVSRETLDSDNRVVKLRMSKIDLADEAALPENRGGDQESGGRRGSSLDGYSGVRPGHAHRLSWSALPGTGRGGSTGALVLPPTPATEGNDDRRLSVPAVITRPWPLHSNSDSSSNTSVSGPSTSKL